jgi:hypothetical protein
MAVKIFIELSWIDAYFDCMLRDSFSDLNVVRVLQLFVFLELFADEVFNFDECMHQLLRVFYLVE